jgi:hypothetical protein
MYRICYKNIRQLKDTNDCNVDRVGSRHDTTTMHDTKLKNWAQAVAAYGTNNHISKYRMND